MADPVGPLIKLNPWWRVVFIILRSTFDLPWTSLVPLEEGRARDVGVKNDLLHYMCVIGEKKVDAVLKVVVEVGWLRTLVFTMTAPMNSHTVIFLIESA